MKKVWKFIKCTISIVICLALTLGCISVVQNVLVDKTSEKLYGTFKEIGNDLDVLFLGSSHVWEGVYPMELWKDYGMASYIVGYSAYRIPMSYWSLELAYLYSQPKLVVIDVALLSEAAISNNPESVHTLLDAFPYSDAKLRASKALTDTLEEKTKVFDLVFPLSSYHGRWNKLTEEDFKVPGNYARGARIVNAIVPLKEEQQIPKDQYTTDYNISMQYLEEMINLAQVNGSEVLLTFLPQPSTEEAQLYYNWCYQLEEKYGVKYLDFTDIPGVVDYSKDFNDFTSGEDRKKSYEDKGQLVEGSVYDNSAHLNYTGALKITKYLGDYITENYDIPDHSNDTHYSYWNTDYELWNADKPE